MTKEQREARELVRELLKGEAETVHEALMSRIRDGDSLLIRYAHEQLHGKAPDKLEGSLKHSGMSEELAKALAGLSVEELRAGARDDGSADE